MSRHQQTKSGNGEGRLDKTEADGSRRDRLRDRAIEMLNTEFQAKKIPI